MLDELLGTGGERRRTSAVATTRHVSLQRQAESDLEILFIDTLQDWAKQAGSGATADTYPISAVHVRPRPAANGRRRHDRELARLPAGRPGRRPARLTPRTARRPEHACGPVPRRLRLPRHPRPQPARRRRREADSAQGGGPADVPTDLPRRQGVAPAGQGHRVRGSGTERPGMGAVRHERPEACP